MITFLVAPIVMIGSIKVSDLYLEQIFYKMYRDMRYNDGFRPYKIEDWGMDNEIQ